VSSHSRQSSVVSQEEGAEDRAHVWVNAAVRGLPVLACSASFAMLGGPEGPCDTLARWLREQEAARIHKWLHRSQRSRERQGKRVRLQPNQSWHYDCSLSVCNSDPPPALAQGVVPVCVVLRDVSCRVVRPKRVEEQGHLHQPRQLKTASARVEATETLGVWASMPKAGTMRIGEASGLSQEALQDWRKEPNLLSWLEQPDDMVKNVPVVANYFTAEDLPCQLGSFAFIRPGSCGPPARFRAQVAITRVRQDPEHLFPIFLELKLLQEQSEGAAIAKPLPSSVAL